MILVKKPYDYLIVGAGPYGSVSAYELTKRGKKCLVIDKRGVIGGTVIMKTLIGFTFTN